LKVNLYFLADIEKKNDRGSTPAADPSFPLINARFIRDEIAKM